MVESIDIDEANAHYLPKGFLEKLCYQAKSVDFFTLDTEQCVLKELLSGPWMFRAPVLREASSKK